MYKFSLERSTLTGKIAKEELIGKTLNPKNNPKRTDVISVKNLKITDNNFLENVAKKNINKKIQQLLILIMKVLDTDSTDDDFLVLDEADRIKSLIINEYAKILGEDYRKSVIKKIDYIIKEFNKKKTYDYQDIIEKSGKSR